MQLKYTGPKPIISPTGIVFDHEHEDKYRYIPFAVYLLKALEHDDPTESTYTYSPHERARTDDELLQVILHYCPTALQDAERRFRRKSDALNAEAAAAEHLRSLQPEARRAWLNNLKLMHGYRLQRTVNKSFYYSAVGAIASVIDRKQLLYIRTPFRWQYFHVFHSVEGVIRNNRKPVNTILIVYEEGGELIVRLDIASRRGLVT